MLIKTAEGQPEAPPLRLRPCLAGGRRPGGEGTDNETNGGLTYEQTGDEQPAGAAGLYGRRSVPAVYGGPGDDPFGGLGGGPLSGALGAAGPWGAGGGAAAPELPGPSPALGGLRGGGGHFAARAVP